MSKEWRGRMLLVEDSWRERIIEESEGNNSLDQYFRYDALIPGMYRKLNDNKMYRQKIIDSFRAIAISPPYDELVDVERLMSKEELTIFDIARIQLRCWFQWNELCICFDWDNLHVAKWQAAHKDSKPKYELSFHYTKFIGHPIRKGVKLSSLAAALGLYKPARGMKENYIDGNVMNVTPTNLESIPASKGREAYCYQCHRKTNNSSSKIIASGGRKLRICIRCLSM